MSGVVELAEWIAALDGVAWDTATIHERRYYENIAEIRSMPPEKRVIAAAVAYCDQLNAFNNIAHPEVHRRRKELADAVGAMLRGR